MEDWQEEPLNFSEILDVTFRIIKENFIKLFQIMLIFMGPVYVIQGIGNLASGMSILAGPNRGAGITGLINSLAQAGVQGTSPNLSGTEILLLVISTLLLVFIAAPMAHASLLLATEQIRHKETVDLSTTIKRAFARFWPLLGGSMLFGLIIYGLLLGVTLVIGIYAAVSGMLGMFTGAALAPANMGINVLVIIILGLGSLLGFIYLMTRWSFFFAAIVFEKVSPGLSKSWRLTRRNFWRIIGLYLVVAILTMIIASILQTAIAFVLGNSLLAFLLNSVVSIVVSIMLAIAYAVIYFDLRIRNEAIDLKGMLANYEPTTKIKPVLAEEPSHVVTSRDEQPIATEDKTDDRP